MGVCTSVKEHACACVCERLCVQAHENEGGCECDILPLAQVLIRAAGLWNSEAGVDMEGPGTCVSIRTRGLCCPPVLTKLCVPVF